MTTSAGQTSCWWTSLNNSDRHTFPSPARRNSCSVPATMNYRKMKRHHFWPTPFCLFQSMHFLRAHLPGMCVFALKLKGRMIRKWKKRKKIQVVFILSRVSWKRKWDCTVHTIQSPHVTWRRESPEPRPVNSCHPLRLACYEYSVLLGLLARYGQS